MIYQDPGRLQGPHVKTYESTTRPTSPLRTTIPYPVSSIVEKGYQVAEADMDLLYLFPGKNHYDTFVLITLRCGANIWLRSNALPRSTSIIHLPRSNILIDA